MQSVSLTIPNDASSLEAAATFFKTMADAKTPTLASSCHENLKIDTADGRTNRAKGMDPIEPSPAERMAEVGEKMVEASGKVRDPEKSKALAEAGQDLIDAAAGKSRGRVVQLDESSGTVTVIPPSGSRTVTVIPPAGASIENPVELPLVEPNVFAENPVDTKGEFPIEDLPEEMQKIVADSGIANSSPLDVVELDSSGRPWDSRIDSGAKSKVSAGTWKKLRGVDATLYASIIEGHKQGVDFTAGETVELPNSDLPVHPDFRPPAAPVQISFTDVLKKASGLVASGSVTQCAMDAVVIAALNKHGLETITQLATKPELASVIYDTIAEAFDK